MAHDIFISYATKDESIADEISRALETQGIRCWYAPRDIPYGLDFEEAIIDAISTSRLMIVVISPDANDSPHVKREVQFACSEDAKVPILPFLIKNVSLSKAFRYYIGSAHRLNASAPPLEQHLDRLARYVRQRLSDAEPFIARDEHAADDAPTQEETVRPGGQYLSGAEPLRDTADGPPPEAAPDVWWRRRWQELTSFFASLNLREFLLVIVLVTLATTGVTFDLKYPEWRSNLVGRFFGAPANTTPTPTPQPTPTPDAWALKYSFRKEWESSQWVRFLPDGKTCVVKPGNRTVNLLEVSTGKLTLLATSASNPNGLITQYSLDGSILVGWEATEANISSRIMVWDTATASLKQSLPGHASGIDDAVVSPDGRMLLSTGKDAGMKLWDLQTGALRLQVQGVKVNTPDVGETILTKSAFTKDGSTLAIFTPERDNNVRLFDARTGAQKRTLPSQPKPLTNIYFTPNSKSIITSDAAHLRMYEVETGLLQETIAGNGKGEPKLNPSPDGTTIIVSLSDDKLASVYDAVTGSFRYSVLGTIGTTFSPDGKLLVSVDEDMQTKLLDVQTGKPKFIYLGNVQFLPDGKTFVNWENGDARFKLIDAQTGEVKHATGSEGVSIKKVVVSPDSSTLLFHSDTSDSPALLCNTRDSLVCRLIPAEQDAKNVKRIFSPDLKTMVIWVSASTNKGQRFKGKLSAPSPDDPRTRQARLWEMNTGAVQVVDGEENVRSVQFSPDGGAVFILRQTSAEFWLRVNPPGEGAKK